MTSSRAKWLNNNFLDKKTATKQQKRDIRSWWKKLNVIEKKRQVYLTSKG